MWSSRFTWKVDEVVGCREKETSANYRLAALGDGGCRRNGWRLLLVFSFLAPSLKEAAGRRRWLHWLGHENVCVASGVFHLWFLLCYFFSPFLFVAHLAVGVAGGLALVWLAAHLNILFTGRLRATRIAVVNQTNNLSLWPSFSTRLPSDGKWMVRHIKSPRWDVWLRGLLNSRFWREESRSGTLFRFQLEEIGYGCGLVLRIRLIESNGQLECNLKWDRIWMKLAAEGGMGL